MVEFFKRLKDTNKIVHYIYDRIEMIEVQVNNLSSGDHSFSDMLALEERVSKLEKARGPRGKAKR